MTSKPVQEEVSLPIPELCMLRPEDFTPLEIYTVNNIKYLHVTKLMGHALQK